MSYLLKTNRRDSLFRKTAIYIGGILILWVLGGFIMNLFSPIVFSVFRPIFITTNKISESLNFYFSFLKPKAEIIKENELLKEQSKNFAIWEAEYKLLKSENEYLKGLEGATSSDMILAAVLKMPDETPYDSILIDMGIENGVKEGLEVYVFNSMPIGIIDRVYERTSIVRLFSSPGDSHDVYIGEKKISGKATGRGGGNFEIILPRGEEIKVGDTITSPSIKNRVLGKVEMIEETEGGTFQRILFRNLFSFNDLRFVQILK